jgi:hypothetical protein
VEEVEAQRRAAEEAAEEQAQRKAAEEVEAQRRAAEEAAELKMEVKVKLDKAFETPVKTFHPRGGKCEMFQIYDDDDDDDEPGAKLCEEVEAVSCDAVSKAVGKQVDRFAAQHGLDDKVARKLRDSEDGIVAEVMRAGVSDRVRNSSAYVTKVPREKVRVYEESGGGEGRHEEKEAAEADGGGGHGKDQHEGHEGQGSPEEKEEAETEEVWHEEAWQEERDEHAGAWQDQDEGWEEGADCQYDGEGWGEEGWGGGGDGGWNENEW